MTEPTQTVTRRARRDAAEAAADAQASQVDDLLAYAREWIDDDPDEATRLELEALVEGAEDDDEEARAKLADRFSGLLEFGTAGLRGALGAGPNRMNSAVVLRAAAGLVTYLQEHGAPHPVVVIGYDARLGSAQFAHDTAAVVVGAGGRALVLPRPLPTPVLAFAIRHLQANAGVMVTASHNPAQDNGYKVYLGDGSQIVPPADVEIRRHIERIRRVGDVPQAQDGWEVLGDDVLEAYVEAVAGLVPADAPRGVRIVQTSLHGVGGQVVQKVFAKAGFEAPLTVPEQAEPDPAFPTVPFPNPEETGAIDMALALAKREHPALVLAHDPDADRCAVAIPDPLAATTIDAEGWRMLRGDELGALLAWDVVRRGVSPDDVLARSIVSSRLVDAIAAAAGCRSTETLTGFKWIARAPGLRYGYEEAIGYCVAPQIVRDKDGISAGLLVAALMARLLQEGRTVRDVLDELEAEHGVHATDAFSVRVEDLSAIGRVMQRLREQRGDTHRIADTDVTIADLQEPQGDLPPTEGLRYDFADRSRVIVRPSGTEPKLKAYLEAIVPVQGGHDGLAGAREEAQGRLTRLREAFTELTKL